MKSHSETETEVLVDDPLFETHRQALQQVKLALDNCLLSAEGLQKVKTHGQALTQAKVALAQCLQTAERLGYQNEPEIKQARSAYEAVKAALHDHATDLQPEQDDAGTPGKLREASATRGSREVHRSVH